MSSDSQNSGGNTRSKKLPAILLNADFYTKGRNVRWIRQHGYEAVAILQAVWIASSQERDCKILKEDAYNTPFFLAFPEQKVIEVLESALEVGLLNGDQTHYWNSQIVDDSNSFQKKHNNYKQASQKREKSKAESCQNPSRILPESCQNHIDIDTDSETDTDLKKEGKQKILDFVWMDEVQIDTWKVKLGSAGFDRACEKLNGWIGQSIGTPEHAKRVTAGQNAGFTIQNWVSQAISNESSGRGPPKNRKTAVQILEEQEGLKV